MLCAHLGTIGHPLTFERVHGAGIRKGRRIIEAISPALASGKVVVCKDVLTAEDAGEFVVQFTGASVDGRKLRHDDIIDALSYAIQYCGPALSADDSEFVAAARHDYETIIRMPLRQRVLNEEELELLMEEDEVQESVRLKLDKTLELQQQDIAAGFHNEILDRRVRDLTKDYKRLRSMSRRFVRTD